MSTELQSACDALASDELIAYPTESVFGIGCDPRSAKALERILTLKGRDPDKGFILIAASQEQLKPYLAPLPAPWQAQLDEAWPGPVTFIVPASSQVPALLTGNRDTLAVRVSNHPTVIQLCRQYGSAIVSTSANRSGEAPLKTGQEVHAVFGDALAAIVDAPVGSLPAPTKIIDLASGKRLR